MTANEYRRKNPRCRTCSHACAADNSWYSGRWVCKLKNKAFQGRLDRERLRGILCACYEPRED